jgi:hypothetical protein
MFPSLSLNQAPRSPLPNSATPATVLTPGMSYSSNFTPRDRSWSISEERSFAVQPIAVAWFVPANCDGYRKNSVPSPDR